MTCEVLMGRWLRRCGRSARLYRVVWRGQCLGIYRLCAYHSSCACSKPVDVVRLDARTKQNKVYNQAIRHFGGRIQPGRLP